MGGCYSAAGDHTVYYPKHKQPRESRPKQNGRVSRQGGTQEGYPYIPEHSTDEAEDNHSSEGLLNGDQKPEPKNSDSGIGSLGSSAERDGPGFEEKADEGCNQCQQKLQRNSQTACEDCGENAFKNLAVFSRSSAVPTYCSCGPRHAGRHRSKPGACSTHATSPKIYRNSDIVGLKSSLKKISNRQSQRQNHLSWKSSDSLDYVASMYNSMDHAKSEASEIFRDDISFRAPLAAFDSVDDHLESRVPDMYRANAFRTNTETEIQNLADSICRCEFSASDFVKSLENGPIVRTEGKRCEVSCDNVTSNQAVPLASRVVNRNVADLRDSSVREVNGNTRSVDTVDSCVGKRHSGRRSVDVGEECNGNVSDDKHGDIVCNGLDGGHVEVRRKQGKPTALRLQFPPCDDGLELMSLPSRDDLEMVVVDGREVVLVDVDVYDQVMAGLAQLRSHLSHLTTIIQESQDLESDLNLAESYIEQDWPQDCQDQ